MDLHPLGQTNCQGRPFGINRLGCKQANLSPSCFIYTWCLLPLTWILTLRVGGISRKTVCCLPLIPCLPTPFSFLFKAPGIAKWHVLNTECSQLKIPKHMLICTGTSSPGALQTLSHLSLKTPREVGCGQTVLFPKSEEGFKRKGQHLSFYTEAQQTNSGLKLLSLRSHHSASHSLGMAGVHVQKYKPKDPGTRAVIRLRGIWKLLCFFGSFFWVPLLPSRL